MPWTRLPASLLVAALLVAMGCATVRVKTDHDPETDFSALRTFGWLEPPLREQPKPASGEDVDPFAHNTLLDKRVRSAVEAELAERGYAPAAAGETPDFQLRYHVILRDRTRTVSQPVFVGGGYHRYPYSYSGYYGTYTYEEGTLVLDVIDPGSEQITWRGWGRGRTDDAHLGAEEVKTYVEEILARFPPEPAEPPASPED